MKIQLSIGIIIFGFLISCTNKKYDVEVSDVEINTAMDFSMSIDTISSSEVVGIHYLPLKGSDSHFIGDITKMYVQDDFIIIGNKGEDKLICYNRNGEFQYEINSKGAGPEEYLELASFAVTNSSIYTIDNYLHKINKYSLKDGKFLSKNEIKFVAWDIEAFDDNDFLFTCMPVAPGGDVNMKVGNFVVWRTNKKWEIEDYYLPYKDDFCEPFYKRRWFTKNNDEIQIALLNYNGFFTFKQTGEALYTPINFSNPWPRENGNIVTDFDGDNVEYVSETPLLTTKFGLLEITKGMIGEYYLFEKNNGKFYCNSRSSAKYFMYNIKGVKDNTFIGVINDNYENYLSLVEYGFPKADKETEALLERGGMCLIMYDMK